ncbi:MAG: DUF58 domain-containing protein [Dehalococcoidia bacterium]|nr:DUF58 domain-containing protein [Dehalococcoidia bacterium]
MKMSLSQSVVSQEGRQSASEPVGFLLSKFGLLTVLAALLLAAWAGQIVLVILLGLILSAAGLARLWSRLSLEGVRCERLLSERRVFPGENIQLKLRVVNRKLLPMPWLQVDDEIPGSFTADGSGVPGSRIGYAIVSKTGSLLWYSAISWQSRLSCNRRGYYPLGPLSVTSGDIFGFYPRYITEPVKDYIIVYPKLYPVSHISIPSLYPLGETRSERRIFEDPSRTIGVREYAPGDSLRRIHWKASARQQSLQVRVFEATTTLKVALCLAVDSFYKDGQCDQDKLELGISTVASVASYLVEHGSQSGLLVNSLLADSRQPARIPPGGGDGQLVTILEALAKVTPSFKVPFSDFLQSERKGFPHGTTLVFVISQLAPALAALVTELAESGYKMMALQIGDEQRSGIGAEIPWCNIRQPGDLQEIGVKEQW